MASYSVHLPPDGDRDGVRFLDDRLSLFAFLLPPVFLLWHRLWFAFGIYVLVVAAITIVGTAAGNVAGFFLSALPALYLLIAGKGMVRSAWEGRGWEQIATVEANSLDEAELRCFGEEPAGPRPVDSPQHGQTGKAARLRPATVPAKPAGIGLFD